MPRGITQEQVFSAADALLARGERPTIERVRRELGRGSPNTVNPLLDAWWRALSARLRGEDVPEAANIPPALREVVHELYKRIHESATEEGDAQLTEDRRALRGHESALAERETQLEAERAALAAPLETLQNELVAQREANQALSVSQGELRQALAEAQAEAGRLSNLLSTAEADHERVREALGAELARVHERGDTQEKHWLVEIDRLRQDLRQRRAEATDAHRQTARLEKRLAQAQTAESARRRELQALQKAHGREREARIRAEAASAATKRLVQSLRKGSPSKHARKGMRSASAKTPPARKAPKKKAAGTSKKRPSAQRNQKKEENPMT